MADARLDSKGFSQENRCRDGQGAVGLQMRQSGLSVTVAGSPLASLEGAFAPRSPRAELGLGARSRSPQGLRAGVFLQLFQRNRTVYQHRYLGFIGRFHEDSAGMARDQWWPEFSTGMMNSEKTAKRAERTFALLWMANVRFSFSRLAFTFP
jgi:hypothetical protein